MKFEIVKDNLVITLPLQTPTASKTGRTLLVAGTNGSVKTDLKIDGKQVTVGVNAYISK